MVFTDELNFVKIQINNYLKCEFLLKFYLFILNRSVKTIS